MEVGDVIQFNENHKWTGCLGIIDQVKDCGANGIRYRVYITIPQEGTAYIFVMSTENAIEKIGEAKLVIKENKDE